MSIQSTLVDSVLVGLLNLAQAGNDEIRSRRVKNVAEDIRFAMKEELSSAEVCYLLTAGMTKLQEWGFSKGTTVGKLRSWLRNDCGLPIFFPSDAFEEYLLLQARLLPRAFDERQKFVAGILPELRAQAMADLRLLDAYKAATHFSGLKLDNVSCIQLPSIKKNEDKPANKRGRMMYRWPYLACKSAYEKMI